MLRSYFVATFLSLMLACGVCVHGGGLGMIMPEIPGATGVAAARC